MAASFNKVILLGNPTRDPELRVTPGGLSICKFGLAVNRRYTTKDGEQREETTFVDIDSFGKQAEVIAKYCTKGSSIMVEGRLKLDQWESPQGEKRSKLGVVAENFTFTGGSPRGGSADNDSDQDRFEDNTPPRRTTKQADDQIEDDVPF
jgi:single-strand DNA-binding protein